MAHSCSIKNCSKAMRINIVREDPYSEVNSLFKIETGRKNIFMFYQIWRLCVKWKHYFISYSLWCSYVKYCWRFCRHSWPLCKWWKHDWQNAHLRCKSEGRYRVSNNQGWKNPRGKRKMSKSSSFNFHNLRAVSMIRDVRKSARLCMSSFAVETTTAESGTLKKNLLNLWENTVCF